MHLDLLVTDLVDGGSLAVELKYLTDRWEGVVDGELFALLRHGAQDVRAYDCVRDFARVERAVAGGYAREGLVLVLANDPAYWRAPTHGRLTNADAFRLHDGLTLGDAMRQFEWHCARNSVGGQPCGTSPEAPIRIT